MKGQCSRGEHTTLRLALDQHIDRTFRRIQRHQLVRSRLFAGALAFSNHWFTTDRLVLGDQLTANLDVQSYDARIEGCCRYAVLPAIGATSCGAVRDPSGSSATVYEDDGARR